MALSSSLRVAAYFVCALHWVPYTSAASFNYTEEQLHNANRNLSIGYLVYHGFQPLDVFGPLDMLYDLSDKYNMTLSIIAEQAGPIHIRGPPHKMADGTLMDHSRIIDASIVASHSFDTAPALDIIIVTGGIGNRALVEHNNTSLEQFVARRFDTTDYVLSVCTGSALLARAGVLEGRKATGNKAVFEWITTFGKNVTWVPSARWVHDGKVWTSSGVSAGIDMIYAFLSHIYGEPRVNNAFNLIEYAPHLDPDWDPFSVVHRVPGAHTNRSLTDCVTPVKEYDF